MKKTIALLLSVLFIFSIIPFTVSAANESEPNETYQNATQININTNVYGNIANGNDNDFYRFTLTEKGSVQITFKHENVDTSNTRWEIYLYSSDGTTSIDGGDACWSVPGDTDVSTAEIGLEAGSYYIRVKAWNANWAVTSTYTLRVNFTANEKFESELNNSRETADEIENNRYVYGSISSSGDEDWFKFTLKEKGYISLWFSHPNADTSSTRWEIYLYHEDGYSSIDGGNGYWSVAGNSNLETAEIGLDAGVYYVRVKAWSNSWVVDSTYTLDVYFTESEKYEVENNNTYSKADNITLFDEINGSISTPNDADWYKLVIPESGKTTIGFKHLIQSESNPRWTVVLYQSNASTQVGSFNVSPNANYEKTYDLSAGTYYIKVVAWSNSWVVDETYNIFVSLSHICNGNWTVVTQPDCSSKGEKVCVCYICNKSVSEPIPKTEHSHNAVVTPPNCTDRGYTTYTCKCGDTYISDYVKENGHTAGDWVIVKEPEIGVAGKREQYCTECNELVDTEDIDALAPACLLGDVNNNGEIEKYDYILVKRAVMKTVTLNETQIIAANVNQKDGVDKYDYILIKRHVMKTFVIA